MFKWTDGSQCERSQKNSSYNYGNNIFNKKEISYMEPTRE